MWKEDSPFTFANCRNMYTMETILLIAEVCRISVSTRNTILCATYHALRQTYSWKKSTNKHLQICLTKSAKVTKRLLYVVFLYFITCIVSCQKLHSVRRRIARRSCLMLGQVAVRVYTEALSAPERIMTLVDITETWRVIFHLTRRTPAQSRRTTNGPELQRNYCFHLGSVCCGAVRGAA
jgi:hypothetical protein